MTGAYHASGQGTMVAETRSRALLMTAADMNKVLKRSELTP